MAEKKVGALIKEARTEAGLTQEKLADKAGLKLTAAMISECERGKADLSSAQLKKIAVVCGVTQSSLLNAPKNIKTTEKKDSDAGRTTAKSTKTKTSSSSAGRSGTASSAKKTAASSATKKTAASSATKKTAASSSAKKTSTSSAAGKAEKSSNTKSAAASSTMKVSTAEKKIVEAYREASAELRKTALKVLKGEYSDEKIDALNSDVSSVASSLGDGLGGVLGDVLSGILGGKS